MTASSFSLHYRPILGYFLTQGPWCYHKVLDNADPGKIGRQKGVKGTLPLPSDSTILRCHPSPCAFASKYKGNISLSICLVIVACIHCQSLEPLLPILIFLLLLTLCPGVSQHGRLSPCHSVTPERKRFLLCALSAQCIYTPALST